MHHKIWNYSLILICCLLSYVAIGQKMESLTVKDGLSQGMIFDIVKDKDGFMWFATKDGLNRYDGYNFKVFTNNPYDSTSLAPYLKIEELFIDSKDRLWVNAASLYNKEQETFYNFKTDGKKIRGLVEDKNGNLWCIDKNIVYQLQLTTTKNGIPQLQLEEKAVVKGVISTLHFKSDGTLLIGTWEGLFKFNPTTNQLKQTLEIPALSIVEYPKGTAWIGTMRELVRMQDGKLTTIKLTLNQKRYYIRDDFKPELRLSPITQKIWLFSSTPGAVLYEIDPLPLSETYSLDKAKKIVLEKGHPVSTFIEKNKNLWVGTSGYGVRKISLQHYTFHHLLAGKSIRGNIALSKKGVVSCSYYGIENDIQKNINIKENTTQIQNNLITTKRTVRGVLRTKSGGNWILVEDASKKLVLAQMDDNLVELHRYSLENIEIPKWTYHAFIEGQKGNLWLAIGADLVQFNTKTKKFIHIKSKTPIEKTNNFINNSLLLYQDKAGIFWNGTTSGLRKITITSANTMTEQIYEHSPKDIYSLSKDVVACMLDDPIAPNRYLWVATKGGGLNKLDKKTGKFEHFTTKDGLSNDVVYGMLPDDDGNLWLSTNYGISKFNPTQKTFLNFVKADGLQENEFNTSAFFKDEKTGILYFGGINGITAFHPKDIQLSDFKPKIYINQLTIHGEVIEVGKPLKQRGKNPLTKAIEFTKSINLPWYQNQITLDFVSLDFAKPSKNLYQYQLSSVDKDWVQAGTRRSVNYSNLATGTYTFRLKATNSDGRWNEAATILKIVIYPPWYRTNSAYTLYALLLIFGMYKLYQDQIRRAKLHTELAYEQKEAARLAEIDKIKTNFFSNITHEFRTPLTLIIEPLRQYLKNPKKTALSKVELAKNNSERLLTLVNQLLDLSKLESKKMTLELKKGDFLEFVAPIMASFKGLAAQKGIRFIYNTPNELPFFDFDKNKVEKVLFNLISNAIKFTKTNGTVTINIIKNTQHQQLQIQVIDTGIGIPAKDQPYIFDRFYQVDGSNTREHQGTGIGLALSKELTEVMNGSLTFKSDFDNYRDNKGSTFEVLIPMVQVSSVMNKSEQIEPIAQYEIPLTPMAKISNQTSEITIDPDATNVALVIEDNEELRLFIKSSIEHQYKVIEAKNGQEGLNLAIKYLPNIIVSDVMMPIMDGFEVCKRVKTNEKTAHIPVILLTAKTAMDSVLKGLAYKADAYMKKPFNIEELLVRMKNLIEVRVLLQQKFTQTLETMPLLVAKPTKTKLSKQSIPEDPNLSSFDQRFLKSISNVVEQNLDNENLTIEDLAKTATMSRSQLYRKIKALLNQTPSEFIRNIRLKAAKQFLEQRKGNVTDITFMVGFSSPSYFSTQFKKKYGVKPSEV